ncbi:jasmonate-induced oxygenase 4-like [Aristolochia californica]|uniref:jasmonate-induced oxygenase 4-like n=1 Tax=Aristolochia californica TaxID=171875 RepID=UPI0035E17CB1
MATSPERTPQFRAPPPSPISNANSRRTAAVDDEDLTDFLDCSFHVPDLLLPDRIFPREIPMIDPPEIDFRTLISVEEDPSLSKSLEYATGFGCFQLVNHGISNNLIESVKNAAAGVFEISEENKEVVKRSPGRRYGFEEVSYEEEEGDVCEEFYWCRNEEKVEARTLMEGIWPDGFSNFSRRTEELWREIEKVAGRVTQSLIEASGTKSCEDGQSCEEMANPVLCLYKHGRNIPENRELSALKSDVIRMLIRRSDYPHALCIHACNGASEFHVYSSRIGWMSFSPDKEALLVTIGDQMQVWTDGLFKHAVGRPIFHLEDEDDPISMAFIYTPTTVTEDHDSSSTENGHKTVSVRQQVMVAICLTLVYHLFFHIYNMMAATK